MSRPTDIVIDTLYEGAVERFAKVRSDIELVVDPRDEEGEIPFYTPEGYMVIRVPAEVDANAVVEELRRQQRTAVRIVGVFRR